MYIPDARPIAVEEINFVRIGDSWSATLNYKISENIIVSFIINFIV